VKVSNWRSSKKGGWVSARLDSVLVRLGGMFLVALVMTCTGCSRGTTTRVGLEQVAFTDDGITLALSAPVADGTLEIALGSGAPVQSLPLHSLDLNPRVGFRWQSNTAYRFTLVRPERASSDPIVVTSPQRLPLRAVLRVPYGQSEVRLEPVPNPPLAALASEGTRLQVGIELSALTSEPVQVEAWLKVAPGLDWEGGSRDHSETDSEGYHLLERTGLSPAASSFQRLERLHVPQGTGEYAVSLKIRYRLVSSEQRSPWSTLRGEAMLVVRPLERLRRDIEVLAHRFPADAKGRPDVQRLEDTVALPNPIWELLGTAFGADALSFDPYAPYAFQSVRLRNHTPWAVTLLVKARTLEANRDREVAGFVPRAFEVTGGTGRITSLATIQPEAEGIVVVPFYIRPEVREGRYRNLLQVSLMGTDRVLHVLERPLQVVRSNTRVTITLLVVIPMSLLATLLFAMRHRTIIAAFDTRALTTIALFGALMFAVGFLVDLLSTGLNVALGPFNILVSGLMFEVFHHLVLAALLTLYPRRGIATLVGLTHYLIRGLTTGQLSPVDVLFIGSSLTYKELALFCLGVTRGASWTERLRTWPWWETQRLAAALALAACATAFTSLALHTAFYRLFFAEWYVWLTLLVALVGAWPGATMGVRFGQSLARVQD